MLSHGANVDARDHQGGTALIIAASSGCDQMMEVCSRFELQQMVEQCDFLVQVFMEKFLYICF